jgi:hypothetical protein
MGATTLSLNDIRSNDTLHCIHLWNNQHHYLLIVSFCIVTLSVIMLDVIMLSVVLLNVVMKSVVMVSVIMQSVILLDVCYVECHNVIMS